MSNHDEIFDEFSRDTLRGTLSAMLMGFLLVPMAVFGLYLLSTL